MRTSDNRPFRPGTAMGLLRNHAVVIVTIYLVLGAIIYGFAGVGWSSASILPIYLMYVFINKDRLHNKNGAPFVINRSIQLIIAQRKLFVVAGILALFIYAPIAYFGAKLSIGETEKAIHGAIFIICAASFIGGWGHVKLTISDPWMAFFIASLSAFATVMAFVFSHSQKINFPAIPYHQTDQVWLHGFVVACVGWVVALACTYFGSWMKKSLTGLLTIIQEVAPAAMRMVPVIFMMCAGTVILNMVFASAYMQFPTGWILPNNASIKIGDYSDHVFFSFYIIFGGAADNLMSGGPPRRITIIAHLMLFVFWLASFLQLVLTRVSSPSKKAQPLAKPAPTLPVRRPRSSKKNEDTTTPAPVTPKGRNPAKGKTGKAIASTPALALDGDDRQDTLLV